MVNRSQCPQQPAVSLVDDLQNLRILVERILYHRLHIAEDDNRRLHVHGVNRLFAAWICNIDKSLLAQNVDDSLVHARFIHRMIDYISKVPRQQLRKDLRQYDLTDVGYCTIFP